MKRIFLLTLSALALAGTAHADDPQIIIHSTHAEEDARNAAIAHARTEAAKEAVLHGELSSDAIIDEASRMPGLLHGLRHQAMRSKLWQAAHPLIEGDRLPLGNQYDDAATIRVYLHESGYTDLSDVQIRKVQDYMKANGIKHVSELGL